jgi:molecular chaperone DnaJ
MMRDYYEVLGVERGCDDAALKSAFRKLAMQHHPDRNGGCEEAAGRFKEINEAYSILSDANKRQVYDRFGHAGLGGMNGQGGAGFADVHDIFNDVFGDVFGDMFGRGRSHGPARGQDLRYDLEITLEQAYSGEQVQITVPAAMTCEVCEGAGAKPGTHPTTCTTCNGQGRVRRSQGFFAVETTCPRCGGAGRLILDPCQACAGHGMVRRERLLDVRIPAGVDDGSRIRLSGEGDAGVRGGPRGDLYIFVSVRPHELFERDGLDLLCSVPVPMTTAALGGEIDAPCLLGGENCDGERKVKIKIPEGAQTGRTVRLRGRGMPSLCSRK